MGVRAIPSLWITYQPLKRFIGSFHIQWMVLNGKTRGFLLILDDLCRFSVFFAHFWSILIPGGFVRPRKNSRHTNSARRIETGRLEASEIPQIPRKINFGLLFLAWAGPGPGRAGPSPGRARASPDLCFSDCCYFCNPNPQKMGKPVPCDRQRRTVSRARSGVFF